MRKQQAAIGIVFDESLTSILLIKRRDIPVWVLPGGGIEENETPEQAVCREVFEESGYQVEVVRKVAEYLPVNRMTQVTHFFQCRVTSGSAQITSESQKVDFFPVKALPKLLPHFYRDWIQDALQFPQEPIRKKIRGVTYAMLVKLLIFHPVLVSRYLLTKIGIHINQH
jgi:8-oxo-dGTP diphosphatase